MNGLERPTARIQRLDMSPVGPRASAAPASRYRTDHELRAKWVDGRREEPCACGGLLVQYLNEPAQEVVALHNLSTQHQRWRDARPS